MAFWGGTGRGKRGTLSERRGSLTAAKIARGVVLVAADPLHARLLPAGAAEATRRLALASGILQPWMISLFRSRRYRRGVEWTIDLFSPGELMRMTLRKRFVDDTVRECLAGGARQLLILGPGFDTLGPRIAAAHPDLRVLEIDTPATASRRIRGLKDSIGVPENLQLLGRDLERESLGGILLDRGWDPDAPSIAVAEGVLMYLTEFQVRDFLGTLRGHGSAGGDLIFTFMNLDAHGRPFVGHASGLSRLTLRMIGEGLHWGVPHEGLEDFLRVNQLRLIDAPEPDELAHRYLEPLGEEARKVGGLERMAHAKW